MPTPAELIGTDDAPWRAWCRGRGHHPVEILRRVQALYEIRVPSHPEGAPLRLRHVDERIDELRELVVEAVRQAERAEVAA